MQNRRRERFLAYYNEELKGDRAELMRRLKKTKGRITQLLDPRQPFGEKAAESVARGLGLAPDYFERDRLTDLTEEERELVIRFRALRSPASTRYLMEEAYRLAAGEPPPPAAAAEWMAALMQLPAGRAQQVAIARSLRALEGREVPAANDDATTPDAPPTGAPGGHPRKRPSNTRG